jgi:hypothetical protein
MEKKVERENSICHRPFPNISMRNTYTESQTQHQIKILDIHIYNFKMLKNKIIN